MNPAIDSRSGGGRLGRSAWLLLAACALFAVWTVAARPAGGFVVVQDSEPPPFDDGLNQEERELINRPISALTPEERKLRDEYLNKMKEHLVKMMKAKEKEWKKQGLQPGGKKPTTRKPGRKRVEPSKEETPKRPPTARPRKMFTPPPEELPEVPEDNDLLPFDERLYSFSLKNGNYHDLVEMFALYSGLSVMGLPVERLGGEDPADDVITFISARLTDFRATLHQINDLLFYEVSPPLYLYYNTDEHRLELDMFKELRLKLPPSRLFTSLEAVDLAVARDQLMGSDIVRVFFAPESAMKVFNEVVSGMFGEWVLMRIVEGTGLVDYTGRVDILDRIRDYLKRFDDWDQFEGDLHEIPVEFIKPSEALETLRLLVDDLITGTSEAKSRPRTTRKGRSGKDAGLQLESESVLVIAHDGHKVLLVKGLPYKVNEVKKIVDWIDRPTPEDPRDMPVVVKLQNAKAEDVAATLDALINGGSGVPIAPKKGKRSAAPRGMTGEKELLVIIPDSQNNALFLQGPEELITLAQSIIKEHLDIKRETGFRKVEIKFGDPAEIVAKVESLLGPRPKGDRGGKPLQIEVIGNALILRGDQAEMSEAELLIAEFDGEQSEEQETTFVAHLKNAKPSEVVDYLTTLAASRFEPSAKGRSKTRKPRAGNYLADDASSTIVFYGTEREWLNKILPVIETLDEELTQPEGGIVFVELKYADPVSVVSLMNQMLPPAKRGDPAGPKFAPAPRGVIISGLTSKTEEKSIRTMIELMDADPYDAEAFERRIFKLAHAEPEDVEDAIMTMFGSTGGAPAGRKPKGGGARGSGGIRMAITSGGLIITAPKDKMPEIAELIGQLDSEETSVTFIHRIFELENADPEKVEAEIHNLHGKVGGGKGRPRAGKAGEMDKDTIRTSTSSKGIFVIATEEKMTRIAEQVQTMEEHAGRNPVMTRRFDVIYVDAEVLVERLRPMLEIKLADSRSRGKGSGSKRAGSSMLSLQANAQTSSIYVVAPRDIIEEAAKTIALLDQEEADVEKVHEIYECVNAHADDLAMLLNAVYSGGSTLPSTKGKSKRAGTAAERDRILRKLSGSNTDDVEILALPGGKALLISGTREKVDETLARARQIDDKSIPTDEDRVTRTFTLRFADVDSVADGIIEMLGDPVRGKSAPKAGTGMMDMWDLESGPRRAGDISVWPRYATSTLMVVAPQDRMVAIEGFIDQCEQLADPDNTEFQAQPQPFEFYKPKYLSAYEIVSTTRSVMDTVYKVALPVDLDYLDKNTVVLKGTRRYFEEVRDLIEKYVDTADNVGPAELVFSFLAAPPPNVDLTQVMEMIGTFMPDMDIEVQNMSDGVGGLVGSNIPEIPAKNEK